MLTRVAVTLPLLLVSALAGAQSNGPAVIRGRVLDNAGSPIPGAMVEVIGNTGVRADSTGAFRLGPLGAGTFVVRATLLGFAPAMKVVTVDAGSDLLLDITMTPAAHELSAVVVREDSSASLRADPTGFDARRERAQGGHYVLADEIARTHVTETEQVFHGIPSVQVDTGGIVVIGRGKLSLRDAFLAKQDQFNTCIGAQVFVNGTAMPQPFNVNTVPVNTIRGIEIYAGPGTTPVALRSPKAVCGTVAIWTR